MKSDTPKKEPENFSIRDSIFRQKAWEKYLENNDRAIPPKLIVAKKSLVLWSVTVLLLAAVALCFTIKLDVSPTFVAVPGELQTVSPSKVQVRFYTVPDNFIPQIRKGQKLQITGRDPETSLTMLVEEKIEPDALPSPATTTSSSSSSADPARDLRTPSQYALIISGEVINSDMPPGDGKKGFYDFKALSEKKSVFSSVLFKAAGTAGDPVTGPGRENF